MLEPSWSNLKAWEGLPIWTPNPDEALPNLGSGVTSISAKVPAFHFAGQCSLAHAVLWFGTWCNSTGFFPLFKQLGAKWRLFWSQIEGYFFLQHCTAHTDLLMMESFLTTLASACRSSTLTDLTNTGTDLKGCLLHTQCLVHCFWLLCLLSSALIVLASLVFTPLGVIVLAEVSLCSLCCSAQNAIRQSCSNLQVAGVFDFTLAICSAQCTYVVSIAY